MPTAIRIENLSKLYRLGEVGTGTISHDLNRWWARIRGKDDPYAIVGQENRRDQAAKSDYAWALRDINLEVEQGEVLGIIGANGAGKSTLLKLISRITSPTSGFIRAKGRIASLLEVGTGMHPEMTARENIYLNGAILGMKRHEITRKFDEIIDFAGCRMYVDTPVKRYSSGMRVRLGFAVAAFLEPEILIVDEVLAVGDAEFQKKAIGKMKEVSSAEGRTILFVSHNMAAMESLCNRVALLQHGTVQVIGSAREIVHRYTSQNTKSLPSHYKASWSILSKEETRISEAYVLNAVDQQVTSLRFGEPFGIAIRCSSVKISNGLEINIRLRSESGELLFATNTVGHDGPRLNCEDRGGLVCCINQNVLMPGSYRVDIGIYRPGVSYLEYVEGCLGLVVTEVPFSPEFRFATTSEACFAPGYTWRSLGGFHQEMHGVVSKANDGG